jgi:aminocarboxymuconate-semialdehyde decarboxylase
MLERLPDLRICFAFPFTLGRLDYGWSVRPEGLASIPKRPREYARPLHFDSLTHSPANFRSWSPSSAPSGSRWGSDYPFDMGSSDPVAAVGEAASIRARGRSSRVARQRAFSVFERWRAASGPRPIGVGAPDGARR